MYAELLAAENGDVEPLETVRTWKRAEMLRIGIEDVMALVDVEQLHLEMTCLAEACLRFSLEQARKNLKLSKFPFAVIGVGKFGGKELGYGADLDVLFIGGKGADDQERASVLAAEVIEFMSKHTAAGSLFTVDARLRPEGASGPLAGSLQDLAAATGGRTFISSVPIQRSLAARQMVDELRHQYFIAFESSKSPGWHALVVRMREKNLNVRARNGYIVGQYRPNAF